MASLDELRQARVSKLESLKKQDKYPYPARVRKDYPNSYVHEYFDSLATSTTSIFLAGRVKAIRLHGGSAFLDLEDNRILEEVFKEFGISPTVWYRFSSRGSSI